MSRFRSSLGLIALSLCVGACANDPDLYRRDYGVRAIQPNFLPVPAGMKIQERYHQSHTLRVGSYQYADLQYQGKVPVAEVAAYVLDRFNTERFNLEDHQVLNADKEVMEFRRGRYAVTCTVERQDYKTHLKYQLRTGVRAETAPASQPAPK